ncbi:hypothetical protein ACLKA6_003742 [Drosophila palustris]
MAETETEEEDQATNVCNYLHGEHIEKRQQPQAQQGNNINSCQQFEDDDDDDASLPAWQIYPQKRDHNHNSTFTGVLSAMSTRHDTTRNDRTRNDSNVDGDAPVNEEIPLSSVLSVCLRGCRPRHVVPYD